MFIWYISLHCLVVTIPGSTETRRRGIHKIIIQRGNIEHKEEIQELTTEMTEMTRAFKHKSTWGRNWVTWRKPHTDRSLILTLVLFSGIFNVCLMQRGCTIFYFIFYFIWCISNSSSYCIDYVLWLLTCMHILCRSFFQLWIGYD